MCVMRYSAVTNDVPDYYIYKDGEYVETLEGDFLYQLYIENGGVTLNEEKSNLCSRKENNTKITQKKRHIGGKCITFSEDNIIINYKTPYQRLLLNVSFENGVTVTEAVIEKSNEILKKALSTLTERESDVLKLLYGICDSDLNIYGKPRTEVAKIYDISTERIKQIEAKSLRKLRRSSNKQILLGENIDDYKGMEKKNKRVFIYPAVDSVCKFIKVNECISVYDFILKASMTQNEEIQKLLNQLLEAGFEC